MRFSTDPAVSGRRFISDKSSASFSFKRSQIDKIKASCRIYMGVNAIVTRYIAMTDPDR